MLSNAFVIIGLPGRTVRAYDKYLHATTTGPVTFTARAPDGQILATNLPRATGEGIPRSHGHALFPKRE